MTDMTLQEIAGSGGGGGGGCFRSGTLVQQEGGKSTPIELLKEGDEVLSFDEQGKISVSKVTKVHVHEDPQPILRVKFWRGEVFATPNHWVLNQYDAFSEIGRLTTEDALVDGMGQLRPIISAELIGSEPVYNLTVVPNHTFIANDIRVHNGGHRSRFPEIAGSGGGGGKGGGRQAVEAPDSLQSTSMVSIVDLLGEGQIGGIVNSSAKSIFINDTPIENDSGSVNFTGVTWQQRTGTPDQTPIEGFDDVATPILVGVKIGNTTPYVFSVSSMSADSVRIIVSVPSLMRQDTTTGDLHGTEVSYSIGISVNGGMYSEQTPIVISGKTTSKYQKSAVVRLPKPANSISIRVKRITADSTSAALNNELWLDSYAEIIESRLSYPNSALVGVRIDARQFSSIPSRSYLVDGLYIQVPSNYDAATKTYSGIWNGTFKPAISSNPAWILYDVLTNKRYGLGGFISDDQIDKAMLYQLGRYCDERVSDGYGGTEPRFAINTAIQSTAEAYKLIGDISSAFRGMTYWNGSQVSFTQDAPSDATMIYSPANVVGGEFNYSGSARKDRHSVVHVTWNDPADKFRKQIEYVEDAELVRQLGVRKAEIIAFGCTSRGQANRVGRWILYSERYESNIITFTVGIDSALAAPGDVIRIQDPTRAGKRMAGRIVSSTATSVTLDAPVAISDENALISIRLPDGSFFESKVAEYPGEYSVLRLNKTLTSQPLPGAMFIVIEQNLKPLLARVLSIAPQAEGTYQISAVEHNPSKYSSVDFGLSLEVPKTSTVKLLPATPSALQIKETQYAAAPGLLGNKVHISWFGNTPKYELRWRIATSASSNWTEVILTQPSYEIENVSLGNLELEIVGFNALYRSGVLKYSYSVLGKVDPPKPLEALYATGEAMQIRLTWTYAATARDTECVEIWSNASSNNVSAATRIAVLPWPQDIFIDSGKGIGIKIYYFARTKDRSGNFSTWSSAVGETISDPSLLMEQLINQIGPEHMHPGLINPILELISPENLAYPTAELNDAINSAKQLSQQAFQSAKADVDEAKAGIQEIKTDIEEIVVDVATANANAATAVSSIASVAAKVSLIQDLNLDRIDLNAIYDSVESTESVALSQIRNILDQEKIRLNINEDVIPKITFAERAIEKTITDLSVEVKARETVAAQLGNNIAALNAAVETRATETEALAKNVQVLSSTLNNTIQTTILEERATRASETEALSKKLDALSASVGPAIQARLIEESTVRATADATMSSKLTALESKVSNDISAAILEEKNTRAAQDSALATSISELNVKVFDNIAAISTEQQTRAAQDSALATQITTLQAKVDNDIAASIAQESTARATQDSALATQITQLQAKVNNDIAASIATESTTRANETSALATQITQLQAKVNNDIAASIASEATARADADSAQATKLSSLETKTNQNEAAIKAEETARTTQNSAFATQLTELQAKVNNDIAASITTEATARADADSAQASKITALEAKTAGNEAAIINEQTSRTNADSALASSITTLSSRLDNGDFAAVKTKANASVDKAGAKAEAESVLATSLATGELAVIKSTANSKTTPAEAKAEAQSVLATSLATGELASIRQTAESKTTPAQATAAANEAITAALGGSGSLADIKSKALASVDAAGARTEAEKVLSTSLATGELSTVKSNAATAVQPGSIKALFDQELTAAMTGTGRLATTVTKAESSVSDTEAGTIVTNALNAEFGTGGRIAAIKSTAESRVTDVQARTIFDQELVASMSGSGRLAGITSKANASVNAAEAQTEASKYITAQLNNSGTSLGQIQAKANASITEAQARAFAEQVIQTQLDTPGRPLAQIKNQASSAVDASGAKAAAESIITTQLKDINSPLGQIKNKADSAVTASSVNTTVEQWINAQLGNSTTPLGQVKTTANSAVTESSARTIADQQITSALGVGGKLASVKTSAETAVSTANSAFNTATNAANTANNVASTANSAATQAASAAQTAKDANATANAASEGVGRIMAKYVVTVQADGTWAGMTMSAASGGSGSAVVFNTDKFAIALPNTNSATTGKYPFIVATINGQSSVGINGSLIVDGSVNAKSLNVGSSGLGAITNNLGLIKAGRLESWDGKFVIDLASKFISISS